MKLKNNSRSVFAVSSVILCLLLFSCNQKRENKTETSFQNSIEKKIIHAEGFQITHFEDYSKVVIHNPWSTDKTKPFATYYLYKEDSVKLPNEGFKLKIPLKSVIVNTFSYFEFLQQLNCLDIVVGVTDADRIYNPEILQRLQEKKIENLGDPFNPNIEKTLMLKADAIVNSAYVQQDNFSERVQNNGIPVIYSLEWMETTPLARAEWIKLIAAFVDKEAMADSIFVEIESRYLKNKKIVEETVNNPTLLAGDNFQGTWYLPGGNSFNAILFSDAAIDYHYKGNKESGSIGLDIESILTLFGKADVWIGCESDSYNELMKKDKKYQLLQSVKNRRVFNNRNRTTPSGGNDYFESAIVHPDLMLRDLIKAAHPELLTEESFTYLKPLK